MFEKELRQEIDRSFNGEELRSVCADLNLDYDDDLIGRTKDARILSLVQMMQKKGEMPQLIKVLSEHRPQVDWDNLFTNRYENSEIITWTDRLLILIRQNRLFQAGIALSILILLAGAFFIFSSGPNGDDTIPPTEIVLQSTEPTGGAVAQAPDQTPTPVQTEIVVQSTEVNDDANTQTPDQTPTSIPTEVTATATPTPTKNPDVIIIEFEGAEERDLRLARRIEDNLLQTLSDYDLEEVNIEIQSKPVTSITEAKTLATELGSKVVVWGWIDSAGVNIRIYLNDSKRNQLFTRTNELPLSALEDVSSELAFLARGTIPENISFISLFSIGQLYYQNNQYSKGFDAFNAATDNLPETIVFTNESILQYFEARQLDYGGNPVDHEEAACKYLSAIEIDPEFFPAYVNLSILLSNNPELYDAECIMQSSMFISSRALMEEAARLQPNSALIQYNVLALAWQNGVFYDQEELEAVQQLISKDPSIVGAHVMVGSIAAMLDEWELAIESLETANSLLPNQPNQHFNLGQIYVITGELEKAESELLSAYRLQSDDPEILLALANLYILLNQPEEALLYISEIPIPELEEFTFLANYPAYLSELLRSKIAFDTGDTGQAISIVENLIDSHLENFPNASEDLYSYYLLGLLQSLAGDDGAAMDTFEFVLDRVSYIDFDFRFISDMRTGYLTGDLALDVLFQSCSIYQNTGMEPVHIPNPCDSDNQVSNKPFDAQIEEMYDLLQEFLAYRLKNTPGIPLGMACPFVFTYDADYQEWQFDNTIIYQLVGKDQEQAQRRRLQHFDGRLLIKELEPEISYLDDVYVIVVNSQGEETKLAHDFEPLKQSDDRYFVMERGDSKLLTFSSYSELDDIEEVWVVAEGYYIRLDE